MDLVNRLKYYLDENKIAISQFADTCRIPRPTLSQILNGRNKKVSDELITKIHDAYPDLSVLWLMFGEGEMVSRQNTRTSEAENNAEYAANQAQHIEGDRIPEAERPQSATQAEASEKSEEGIDAADRPEWSKNDSAAGFPPDDASRPSDGEAPARTNQSAPEAGNEPGLGFAAEYEEPAIYHSPAAHAGQSEECAANNGFGSSIFGNGSNAFGHQAATTKRPETAPQSRDNAENSQGEPRQPREPGSIVFINTNPLETPSQAKAREEANRGAGNNATRQEKESATTFAVAAAAGKKITNIVVFYSDNSFQSFSPTE
ncbi:MAG: helix-turn-helix domain-containing protein [[Clostridium] fimetarium]|nr:helix-turn-helix domain-containing protein [Alistipes timonensis]MCM1405947.1 helix-turn-helix domain-containing protein [[Clostridium] fimetarium]